MKFIQMMLAVVAATEIDLIAEAEQEEEDFVTQ